MPKINYCTGCVRNHGKFVETKQLPISYLWYCPNCANVECYGLDTKGE